MSCFLVLNAYAGEDQEVAAKKLAMMFRMAPQQAQKIVNQVAKGKEWQFKNQISDQQAAVAENFLKGIGFNVARSGGGQQAVVDQIVDTVAEDSAPSIDGAKTGVPRSPHTPPPSGADLVPPGGGGGTQMPASPPPKGRAYEFHGSGWELFKISFVNWILTILTLGIYHFWGKTKVRRYLCEQSAFVKDRFSYHGTGGELFKGAIVFGLILTALNLGVQGIAQVWGPEAALYAQLGMTYLFLLLLPIIMVGAFRYRLSRTAWRGIRFSFRGKRLAALWMYVKGYFLSLLTLGLYMPYFVIKMQKFWIGQAHFGSQNFEYHGKGKDISKPFLLFVLAYFVAMSTPFLLTQNLGLEGTIVSIVTVAMWLMLGVVFCYYAAFLARYHWSKTRFAQGTFTFGASGKQFLAFNFVNILLLVVTLGLAYPWVVIRKRQYMATHLAVAGNMQLSAVVQEAQQSGILGEGFADGFDMDIDIGI